MKSWFKAEYLSGGPGRESNDAFAFDSTWLETSVEFCDDPELSAFFSGLCLLRGVPLGYLTPDESMLPDKSLRVFRVDQAWVDALMDGALSLGRNCSQDHAHDSALFGHIRREAHADSAFSRAAHFAGEDAALDRNSPPAAARGGFLLRSPLVRAWPGLEACCFKGDTRLTMLRLEHLGDSILLGLADGEMDAVEFTEPVESLAFGFDATSGGLEKPLASLLPGREGEVPPPAEGVNPVAVPFRDKELGVVDVKKLAASLEASLLKLEQIDRQRAFSALEFAAQMLHAANRVRFTIAGARPDQGEHA